MEIIKIIILGIIQGVTEFLPISSSAHTILAEKYLGFHIDIATEMVLNFGSLVAMIILMRSFTSIKDVISTKNALKLILGIVPTVVIGFLFKDFLSTKNFSILYISIFTFLGASVMWYAEKKSSQNSQTVNNLSNKWAVFIGFAQSFSFLRGFSRSGTTISAGMISGLTKEESIKFYLTTGIPILAISTLYGFIKLYNNTSSYDYMLLLTGFITSFIFSLFAIRFILSYIPKHSLMIFVIYRIMLSMILLVSSLI